MKPGFFSQCFAAGRLGALAFLVFLPFWGVTLDGYGFTARFQLPLVMALGVTGLALLWGLIRRWRVRQDIPAGLAGEGHGRGRAKLGQVMANLYGRWEFKVLGLLILAVLPFFSTKYFLSVLILCMIYVLLGLGLNIVVGLAGLLDLGYVAFYAVGAYGYALGSEYLGLGFWTALPLAACLAAMFGAVLGFPVLRMHGDYLAIVTLGFGEIIRLVLNNWLDFTGGPNGISAPGPTFFGLEFGRRAQQGGRPFHEVLGIDYVPEAAYISIYLIALLACLLMLRFFSRIKRMPLGRAWEALREDEIASRSLGINHVTTKLSAFSLGAMWGGIAGVIYAAFQGFINPSSFTFFESALILAIVVLGGMGSAGGVVAAAVILTALPELLRDFSHYRILLFGMLMVVMMIWRPRGIMRVSRQSFDLRVGQGPSSSSASAGGL